MPYLLRKHGVAVEHIAEIVALAYLPTVWAFVYSPLVDLGFSRRAWTLFAAASTAVFSALAVLVIPSSLGAVTFFLIAASAMAGLISSAVGAIMSGISPDIRGRVSGWWQAGNIGAGAVAAGFLIWLADQGSLLVLAIGVVALVGLPGLGAFFITEMPRHSVGFSGIVRNLSRDLWDVLRAPPTWFGLLFLLSPVGSAAIQNLISSVGPDYHASSNEVLLVSGIGGGLLAALGSFIGGHVCDRMNRKLAYICAGLLSAIFGLWLAVGPANAFTYGAAYSGYAIAAGIAYAVFTALVLEILGPRNHAAGTGYSLLVASGNLPIAYMTWLDGIGYQHWKVRGMMSVDAVANAGGAILLFFIAQGVWRAQRRSRAESVSIGI